VVHVYRRLLGDVRQVLRWPALGAEGRHSATRAATRHWIVIGDDMVVHKGSAPATIESSRLALRDFIPDDQPAVIGLVSDPEVTRHMHFASWNDDKRLQWFVWCLENNERTPRDAYNWAITARATGAVIGWLGIGGKGDRSCGFALTPSFWGKGYMTEALRAVIAFEFAQRGTSRITATCATDNVASARVLEKAGMTYQGTWSDADFEGNWAHRHHYAITR
jgi:[ribosomal protein S5]-alanine N-acetyltransferase